MEELLQDFSYAQIKTTGVLGTFGRTESQRNFLSTIDQVLFNRVFPDSWKYIGYGMAAK
jgi:hypothetical protein